MAEFITKCPHCNAELQAQDEWNGMEVECPLCHKMFAINKSSAQVETEKTETVINSALAADEKNCPFCNGIIKEQAIFCKHCRADLNQTTAPQEQSFIFICPECDTVAELPESFKDKGYECSFCCETSIAREAVDRNCPFCGEKIKIKATVCKHCRNNVQPLTVPTPENSENKGISKFSPVINNNTEESSAKKNTTPPYTQASITPPAPSIQSECCERGSLSFCELISSSWNILFRRPGAAIGFSALLTLICYSNNICLSVIMPLVQRNHTALGILSLISNLLVIFIAPIFWFWLMLNGLRLRRDQEINPKSIFLYVKPNQWMHFIWGFWRPVLFTMLWSLLLIVPGLIACMKYSMTYYILLDNPELSVKEAMKHSTEITMGHKFKIFCAIFVITMISAVGGILIANTIRSFYLVVIMSYGIPIIFMPFTLLFGSGIYERIRRS